MTLLTKNLKVNDIVSFELHVSGIISQRYDYVKVAGIIPASFADRFGVDAYSLHAQVFRLLPEGIAQDDADSYEFLIIESDNKAITAIGLPWIKQDSITVHTSKTARFTVPNISTEDLDVIRSVIARYGYTCTAEII